MIERRFRGKTLAVVVGGFLAGACGESPDATEARVSERDSAGIAIVENHVPVPVGGAALQFSAEPRLRIGRVEGSQAEQLFDVRGGAVLPDGRIAILNAGTREVRIYGPDGEHLRSFGGAGDGPGEFGFARQLSFLEPDTIMVWDSQRWRTTWFDLEGEVLREDAGRTKYGPRVPEGMFAEGGFALGGGGLVLRAYEQSNVGGELPMNEILRPESVLLLLPSAGDSAIVLPGRYGGIEQMMIEEDGQRQPVVIPFGKHSALGIGGDASMIWAGNNEGFELWGYDTGGRVVRIVRADLAGEPVTPEALAALKELYRETLGSRMPADVVEGHIRRLDLAPLPSAKPHYSSVHPTDDGGLWVQAYQASGDPSPRTYHVFDADGRWVGTLDAPGRFEPLDIGRDYVLAKMTDELDVEYVVLYDLQ